MHIYVFFFEHLFIYYIFLLVFFNEEQEFRGDFFVLLSLTKKGRYVFRTTHRIYNAVHVCACVLVNGVNKHTMCVKENSVTYRGK